MKKSRIYYFMTALLLLFSSIAHAETVTVGTSTSTSHYEIPFGNYYYYSTTETIYTRAEIGSAAKITSIAYQVASTSSLNSTTYIYMGHKSSSTFSSTSDYVSPSGLTLVYSATTTIGRSTGWETYTLSTPFTYNGKDNLVVVVTKAASSYTNSLKYYSTSASNRCLYRQTDNYSSYSDVNNTSTSFSSIGYRPNTRFTITRISEDWNYPTSVPSNPFSEGTGTASDPYLIYNAQELANMSYLVNNNVGKYASANYKLMEDITLNKSVLTDNLTLNSGSFKQWKPIGSSNEFRGYFYGNNHVISGLYINNSENLQGLFGTARNIYDLVVKDSYVKGNSNVGGVAGSSKYTRNCEFHGVVIGKYTVGGITGSGHAYECKNYGTVQGENRVGGIIGYSWKGNSLCFNCGDVSGVELVGGIAGFTDDSGHIYIDGDYYQTGGDYSCCYNTGTVTGSNYVGGIVGQAPWGGGDSDGSDWDYYISHCYNAGMISCTGSSCGALCGNWMNIRNSYYVEGCGTNDPSVKSATPLSQFKDGSVCANLNAGFSSPYFGQRIGTENYPSFLTNNNRIYILEFKVNNQVVHRAAANYGSRITSLPYTDSNVKWYNTSTNAQITLNTILYSDATANVSGSYTIGSFDQLKTYREMVESGLNYIPARLTADIVVNQHVCDGDILVSNTEELEEWHAIGQNVTFVGDFDGGGHTISGLYGSGLFGRVSYGTIKNLGVINSFVNKGVVAYANLIGGICGTISNGTIENCYFSGTVYGPGYVGGIVGLEGSSSIIKNCYNAGILHNAQNNTWNRYYTGGICATTSGGTIRSCYNTTESYVVDCLNNLWRGAANNYDDPSVDEYAYMYNCYNSKNGELVYAIDDDYNDSGARIYNSYGKYHENYNYTSYQVNVLDIAPNASQLGSDYINGYDHPILSALQLSAQNASGTLVKIDFSLPISNELLHASNGSGAVLEVCNIVNAGTKNIKNLYLHRGESFCLPQNEEYTADNAVTIGEQFEKDKWTIICLPYNANTPTDFEVRTVTAINGNEILAPQVSTMEAGKAYLIRYVGEESTYNCNFPAISTSLSMEIHSDEMVSLIGVLSEKQVFNNSSVDRTGNTYYKISEEGKFVVADEAYSCKPFSGYLVVALPNVDGILGDLTIVDEFTMSDVYTLTDGQNFINPSDIVCNRIEYLRTMTNTNWQSLYVPFSMNYDDWKDDFDVARINNVHQYDDDDNGTVDRTELEVIKLKAGYIEANTPYLIKAKETGDKILSFDGAVLRAATENSYYVMSWNTKYTFTGTYHRISGGEMYSNGYYALGGGTLHRAESEENSLGAFRWYMSVTDRDGNPKEDINEVKIRVLDGDWEEDETGVVSVENTVSENDAAVFDMSGRKVNEKDLRKGIYVKNGRKFMVK